MTDTSSRPIRRKPIAVFAVQAIALTWLIGVWPTPREVYPAWFHATANLVFSQIFPGGSERRVHLGPPARGAIGEGDTVVAGFLPGAHEAAWTSHWSAVRVGYWPSAALVALLLATPMAPWSRVAALAGGLLLIELLTLARVAGVVAFAFHEVARGPGTPGGGALRVVLRAVSESLTATVPSAALVLLVWVLVARPRQVIDVSALAGLLGRKPSRDSSSSGDLS